MNESLSLDDIQSAAVRIRHQVTRTPVLSNGRVDRLAGARLFFKCENFQEIGAFKARGAGNAVLSLDAREASRGVAAHSSGNHAAALARAAKLRGIPAYLVMPSNSAAPKIRNVEEYGAAISFCEPTLDAREAACARIIAETGAVLVHPYDNYRVMAGQGTAALELLEDCPDLDLILCPVGGGGLLCGTAVAAKSLRPATAVIGVEPEGADDAARSFRSGRRESLGRPETVADGLRVRLGERNFPLIQRWVDDIVTVSEEAILAATRQMWDLLKIVVEPSAAVPCAAIFGGRLPVAGKRVGIIVSGGNIDLDRLPWGVDANAGVPTLTGGMSVRRRPGRFSWRHGPRPDRGSAP